MRCSSMRRDSSRRREARTEARRHGGINLREFACLTAVILTPLRVEAGPAGPSVTSFQLAKLAKLAKWKSMD